MTIPSKDALYMLAQELLGTFLLNKGSVGGNEYQESVGTIIRAIGYVMGAGDLYGTDDWRKVCDNIRESVTEVTWGFSDGCTDGQRADMLRELVSDLRFQADAFN